MQESNKPRTIFKLELNLVRIGAHVDVEEPGFISDKVLDEAWAMMSDFVIDMLDDLGEEVTDERFREIFIEVCYRIVYREMTMLHYLPVWEQAWKARLGTRERGTGKHNKSPYDDR